MSDQENIGGLGINLALDFAGLQSDLDAAVSLVQQQAGRFGEALNSALAATDAGPITQAFTQSGSVVADIAKEIANAIPAALAAPDTSMVTQALTGVSAAAHDAQEILSGLSIAIATPDVSGAQDAFATLTADAQQAAESVSQDFATALEAPDTGIFTDSLASMTEAAQSDAEQIATDFGSIAIAVPDMAPLVEGFQAIDQAAVSAEPALTGLQQLIMELISTGEASTAVEGLAMAIQAVGPAADTAGLAEWAAAIDGIGSGSEAAASGVEAIGSAAEGAATQMGLFDELAAIPWADEAGQLNLFATELEPIAGAAQSAADAAKALGDAATTSAPEVHSLGEETSAAGHHAEEAEGGFAAMAEQLMAFGEALAITEALKELGTEALNATDGLTRATISLTAITGSAEEAEGAIKGLESLGMADGLSFPSLLTAGTRMQQLLPEGTDVAAMLGHIADGAAVMGTSIEAAAQKFTTLVNQGTASARSMSSLGLNLTMLADALNTLDPSLNATEASAAKAFKALDPGDRITVLQTALEGLSGTAQKVAQETFGGQWQILANQWEAIMAEVGKALLPVITDLTDFSGKVLTVVKSLVDDFTSLPAPVQDAAAAIAILIGSLAPLALGLSGIALAAHGLTELGGVTAELLGIEGGAEGLMAAFTAVAPELVIVAAGLAAIGYAASQINWSEVSTDASNLASNLSGDFSGIADILQPVTDAVKSVGSAFVDFWGGAATIAIDAARLALGQWGTDWTTVSQVAATAIDQDKSALGDLVDYLERTIPGFQAMADAASRVSEVLGTTTDKQTAFIASAQLGGGALGTMAEGLTALSNALDFLGGHYQTMADAAVSNIKRIQQANDDMMHAAADAAGAFTAPDSAKVDQYAKATQDLYDSVGKLNDNLAKADAVLANVQQDYANGEASATDLAKAQAAVDAATTALYGKMQTQQDVIVPLAQATRDFRDNTIAAGDADQLAAAGVDALVGKIELLGTQLEHANANLITADQNLKDAALQFNAGQIGADALAQAEQRAATAADQAAKAQSAYNSALDALDQKFNVAGTAAASMNEAFSQLGGIALNAGDDLKQLGIDVQGIGNDFAPAMSTANKALVDFGINIDDVGTHTKAAKASVDDLIADIPQLTQDFQNGLISSDQYDKALALLSGDISKMGKDDLPAATAELGKLVAQQEASHASMGVIQGDMSAWEASINKLAHTDLPDAIAQQSLYIAALERQHAALSEIQAADIVYDNMQIKLAQDTGTYAGDYILNLEKIKLDQQAAADAAAGMSNAIVLGIQGMQSAWNSMDQTIAQTIVTGGDWGKAWTTILQKFETDILTGVIKGALKPLEGEISSLISSLLPSLNTGLGASGGAIKGLADNAAAASDAFPALTKSTESLTSSTQSAASAMGGFGSSLTGLIGAIGAVVGAIAGIVGDVYLAAIDTKLFHIETSEIEIRNEVQNLRADQWSQYGHVYDRIGELINLSQSIDATLKEMLANGPGGDGGIGQKAQDALTAIASSSALTDPDLQAINLSLQGVLSAVNPLAGTESSILQELDTIDSTLHIVITEIDKVISAINYHGQSNNQTNSLVQSLDSLGGATTEGSHAIVGAINDGSGRAAAVAGQEIGQLQANVTAAQAQTAAALSTADRITALQNEIAADRALMQDAINAGNLTLATQYQTAAQQATAQLLPLLSATSTYVGNLGPAYIAPAATQAAFAATSAGTVVSTAVQNSAVVVATAVMQGAAATAQSFANLASSLTSVIGSFGATGGGLPFGQPGLPGGSGGGAYGTPGSGPGSPGYNSGFPSGGYTGPGGFAPFAPPAAPATPDPFASKPSPNYGGIPGAYAPGPGAQGLPGPTLGFSPPGGGPQTATLPGQYPDVGLKTGGTAYMSGGYSTGGYVPTTGFHHLEADEWVIPPPPATIALPADVIARISMPASIPGPPSISGFGSSASPGAGATITQNITFQVNGLSIGDIARQLPQFMKQVSPALAGRNY